MNFDLFKEYEPLYIIGHKNPDVDSVVSTTILYNIFKSKGIECFPCFLESYEVDEYNLSMIGDCMTMNMKIINNDDNYHYVLVDHNDPTQSVGFGKKIVWGIDHHKSSNILSNVIIRPYCSCSLLIYDSFKKYYDFSNEEKFMIYMASLADSLFFKGSRFSEEDKNLIEELGYDMDSKTMFKKYFIPTDLSGGMEKVFSNVSKKYNYRGVKFDSLVIKTYNENEYLKQDFIDEVEKRDNFLGVWIDFDKEISYAYFNYRGEVKEFIYDFLASRAATVIPDVYRHIDISFEKQ